ncbi:MAG: hypothetical protein WCV70_00100 [Patescibacteria group bacterium]|jgi:hypothetical protein
MKKEVSIEKLVKDARRVLETPFWMPELSSGESYERLHDDHDGTGEGVLNVTFLPDGDATISIDIRTPLRFRNWLGGGMSLRVRNALMLLAWAIKLDNQMRL